jgi:hypothetical protein
MKSVVTKEELDRIDSQARAASELLEDDRFSFFREYLQEAIESAEQAILNNSIREVQESVTITQSIVKTFITPKKVQIDELSGKYQFAVKILKDLEYWKSLKTQLETEIAEGKVRLA